MTMTLDNPQQHRFGHQMFDSMSSYQPNQPAFTNPWSPNSTTASTNPGLYVNSQAMSPNLGLGSMKQQGPRTSTSSTGSVASYGSLPVSNGPGDLLSLARVQTSSAYEPSYTTATSPVHPAYPPVSAAPYESLAYAAPPMRTAYLGPDVDQGRRYSLPGIAQDDRRSFADALDASQGMLAMSQETPRAIYAPANRGRGSTDSYGFPTSAHSTNSSISSGNFSNYYGSVDGSVSDYSTTGSDIESRSVVNGVLPRPQGMLATGPPPHSGVSAPHHHHHPHHPGHGGPPVPQSMMGQFNSKVSSNTQKKHKCKVCDKRFTRPSSLQTHMYSHTGEKPFACDVEGCGRNFSVVSNLRRHLKVHKGGEAKSETSEDHHSD